MNYNKGMYQNYSVEGMNELNNENMINEGCGCNNTIPGVICPPVMECPTERCFHRQILHEVPHVVPINTKIINHHIYKHTYSPMYTCSEENIVSNVTDGCCNKF